jgi:hypothetical protein
MGMHVNENTETVCMYNLPGFFVKMPYLFHPAVFNPDVGIKG